MLFIKGYFYETLQAAELAVNVINQGEGLPNNGYLTQTYCEPAECVGGYYLPFDKVTCKYLIGEVDIELIEQPI